MKADNNEKRLLSLAVDAFDLPAEVLAGMPKITLTGNMRAHIECHKGILEYDRNTIIVNGGAVLLKIIGDKLEITSMNAEELLIKGQIAAVEID